jgi:hypothetical protein
MKSFKISLIATLVVLTHLHCKKACDTPGTIYYKVQPETTGSVSVTYSDNVYATPNAVGFNQLYLVSNPGTFSATIKVGSNPTQTHTLVFTKPSNCTKRTYTIHIRDFTVVVDYVDEKL